MKLDIALIGNRIRTTIGIQKNAVVTIDIHKYTKIRITESKLIDLVKRIVKEDAQNAYFTQKVTGQEMPHDADGMAPDGMDDDSDVNETEDITTFNEEGGPMVPIDPHAGESSSEFDGMTREEARKTINWAAKHYNQTEKARKKAFYAKYGTLKGEE